jgi:tRNA(Ile)-lysidine synthase
MTTQKISVTPGKYIVAVSGGVDSMVLLHLLTQKSKLELVVAHFDHGIRPDSKKDRVLVEKTAKKYGLPFLYREGELGPTASEAEAREARYGFLQVMKAKHGAKAIITAHHQDDMLETAVINMLRGTGRKGLSSLSSTDELVRPLLEWTKKDIREYAEAHQLEWREDSTNADERYLRNYVRRNILTRFTDTARANLLNRVLNAGKVNNEIDTLLDEDLRKQPAANELNRTWYLQLPYTVAAEMMAAWLRRNGVAHFDRTLIEHLVVAAKTARPGKLADVDAHYHLEFSKDRIKLESRNAKK